MLVMEASPKVATEGNPSFQRFRVKDIKERDSANTRVGHGLACFGNSCKL
jgi:hypothetical protein